MFQSRVSFEAPLTPRHFFADDLYAQEQESVFETSWQLAGLASSIRLPGQFLTLQVGRVPVVIRNFDGQLAALRNVCTHRHCSLVTTRSGQSDKLKCPYHGWEFGADGRTRKIPAAKNFPDFDRERYRLQGFTLAICGDLIFVRIAESGPTLQEWLGDLFPAFESATRLPEWKPAVHWELPMQSNWKIPVEISLEGYHIPEVHPATFVEDPGDEGSEHAFETYTTSFLADARRPTWLHRLLAFYEKWILRWLGAPCTSRYEHHHVFPNLMMSRTDSLTLIQVVRPLTATTCVSDAWQFGRQSSRVDPVSGMVAWLWSRFTGYLSTQILHEDMTVYAHVQRGTAAATDRAILGRCEERLFAFQQFVRDRLAVGCHADEGHDRRTGDGVVND